MGSTFGALRSASAKDHLSAELNGSYGFQALGIGFDAQVGLTARTNWRDIGVAVKITTYTNFDPGSRVRVVPLQVSVCVSNGPAPLEAFEFTTQVKVDMVEVSVSGELHNGPSSFCVSTPAGIGIGIGKELSATFTDRTLLEELKQLREWGDKMDLEIRQSIGGPGLMPTGGLP